MAVTSTDTPAMESLSLFEKLSLAWRIPLLGRFPHLVGATRTNS